MSYACMAWADTQITGSLITKTVLLRLANNFNDETGQCDASHARLAEQCETSTDSVMRALAALEKGGFITVQRRVINGIKRTNQYDLNINKPPMKEKRPTWKGAHQAPRTNAKVANTYPQGAGEVPAGCGLGYPQGAGEVPAGCDIKQEVKKEIKQEVETRKPPVDNFRPEKHPTIKATPIAGQQTTEAPTRPATPEEKAKLSSLIAQMRAEMKKPRRAEA